MITRLVFIFTIIVFGIFSSSANAQQILKIFEKPLPKTEAMPEEEFLKKTKIEEEFPVGMRDLAYEISIPEDWVRGEEVSLGSFVLNNNVLSTISSYKGPVTTGVRHKLLIQAIGLTRQITAKEWVFQYLIDNNYSVNGFEEYSDRHAEALYIFVQDGVSYVTRAEIRINGKNLIFIQHFIPLEEWHDNKIMQASVLDSFKLKFPNEEDIISMRSYDFLEVASFSYPEEWKIKKGGSITSVDRMMTETHNIKRTNFDGRKRETLVGTVGVHLTSVFAAQDLDEEIELMTKNLVRKGLYVQEELPDQNGFVFEEEDALSEIHVFEMVDQNSSLQSYEYWIHIMAEGDYFKIVTLLTPNREDAYFKWSENTQIFKMISKSFFLKKKLGDKDKPEEKV